MSNGLRAVIDSAPRSIVQVVLNSNAVISVVCKASFPRSCIPRLSGKMLASILFELKRKLQLSDLFCLNLCSLAKCCYVEIRLDGGICKKKNHAIAVGNFNPGKGIPIAILLEVKLWLFVSRKYQISALLVVEE